MSKSQPVPVEPEIVKQDRIDNVAGTFRDTRLKYIDSLQSALQMAQGERDELRALNLVKGLADKDREGLLAVGKELIAREQRAEKAEAINRRMVELIEQCRQLFTEMSLGQHTGITQVNAMSLQVKCAELLKEVSK